MEDREGWPDGSRIRVFCKDQQKAHRPYHMKLFGIWVELLL